MGYRRRPGRSRIAGGRVTTLDGEPFRYAKAGYENPHFIAWGGLDGPN